MRHLILYDGVCGLCNRLNAFVLTRDTAGVFAFASLQSRTGQAFLQRFGRSDQPLDTMCVVLDYRSDSPVLLTKSEAALFVVGKLGRPWRWLALLKILTAWLRDLAYDVVARYRYRIFGRYDRCLLPTPQHKQRFID
jgi:predicted DCC family thiol-disulfide oxidoreductase YuxK